MRAQRGQHAQVRQEAAREDQRLLVAEEGGELALELGVQAQVPVQEARAGAARAELVDGRLGGRDHRGVVREPEVVVGAQHHHRLALVLGDRPLRTGLWFYLGALGITLVIGVVAAFVLGNEAASSDSSSPKTWVAVVDVVAGALVAAAIAVSVVVLRRHR